MLSNLERVEPQGPNSNYRTVNRRRDPQEITKNLEPKKQWHNRHLSFSLSVFEFRLSPAFLRKDAVSPP